MLQHNMNARLGFAEGRINGFDGGARHILPSLFVR